MARQRKQYTGAFKAKIALEAIKGQRTIQELAATAHGDPNQITTWKKQLLASAEDIFLERVNGANRATSKRRTNFTDRSESCRWNWTGCKRVGDLAAIDEKRRWIEPDHNELSIVRQCELAGLARASLYYSPVGDSAEDLELMRRIDEQYTRTPFYGSGRMTFELNEQGWKVNRKRVQLMRRMGLEAIYPKPRLSAPAPGASGLSHLLRGVKIERPNQVWSTDISAP
jgi:putative transposase